MWVKICGFTSLNEIQAVSGSSPNAIGLNFYRPSSRFVSPETAKEIAASVDDSISKVGVFVDSTVQEIRRIFDFVPLNTIQLHGNYSIADAVSLKDLPIIWVHRLGQGGLTELKSELEQLAQANVPLEACLVDARVEGEWGGSGEIVDWDQLASEYDYKAWPRLILAGGLVPDNIANAIQKVHPWGVDVASGVEQEGKKSEELIRNFITNANSSTN